MHNDTRFDCDFTAFIVNIANGTRVKTLLRERMFELIELIWPGVPTWTDRPMESCIHYCLNMVPNMISQFIVWLTSHQNNMQ